MTSVVHIGRTAAKALLRIHTIYPLHGSPSVDR